MQMLRTPYWILERDVGQAFFRLRRTAESVASLETLSHTAAAITHAFRNLDTKRMGMLLDLRESPIRNDPQFEDTVRPFQERLVSAFGRVAVLVKSPVGRLQVERVITPMSTTAKVFSDESAALAYLAKG
jgi:hypothetical protein